MTPRELFEFLRSNLRIYIFNNQEGFGDEPTLVRVSLCLVNPEDGKEEEIDWDSTSIR